MYNILAWLTVSAMQSATSARLENVIGLLKDDTTDIETELNEINLNLSCTADNLQFITGIIWHLLALYALQKLKQF